MSQERGRPHHRIQSLSPPQRAKSRSHSRDKSGSRSRDASPFSIDSKLATNYIINNPFSNPNLRGENLPILEDDESDIELTPILPVFSSRKNNNNNDNSMLDFSELNQIPLPLHDHDSNNSNNNISQAIEDDFKQQFQKDIQIKDVKKTFEDRRKQITENINQTDSIIDDSTDSDYNIDENNNKKRDNYYNVYNNSIQDTNNNLSNLQTNSSSMNYYYNNHNNDNTSILNNAFETIDNNQNQSKPSSVLQWLGKMNSNLTVGHVINSKNKDQRNNNNKNKSNDIENNMKRVSSSSKILTIANNLIHGKGKISDYDYDNADFDEILNSVKSRDNKPNSGITSNLMKLYNQIPDSSDDDDEEEEEYDYDNDDGYYSESNDPFHHIPVKMTDRVRKFKNNFSRESSRDRFLNGKSRSRSRSRSNSRSRSRSRSKTRNRKNEFEDLRLPNFKLGKEDKNIKKIKKKFKKDKAARITVHIVDLIHRQEFLLTLCKAFMKFGAPNHRLEEYLTLTAKVLEVEATFIYLPGMMIVNFSDSITRTSDLKLVRVGQGLNLNKLDLAHDIFESVVYDRIGVDKASKELNELFESKEFLNVYWIILFYGLSSMFIIIFFKGGWLDMIPSFLLGSLLGFLQCVIAPKNEIYSSIFEIGSAILLSFIGRAIGSIYNGKYFCFSAIVLSGLCNILPGYMILRGALEIQSKSIISGVVGMFYAIIYSLFLGFGIVLGSSLYGWIDKNAINQTTCSNIGKIDNIWRILFIPIYNLFTALTCQARFHQLSIMIIIASCGYVVTYFSSLHFSLTQFNSALGSFTVGLLSNIYDRWLKGFKRFGHCSTQFTSMICGIFNLVPGSVAAKNALSSGLLEIKSASNSTTNSNTTDYGSMTFGFTMIEISIGITVGLFMSTLAVYPLGKKRRVGSGSIGL